MTVVRRKRAPWMRAGQSATKAPTEEERIAEMLVAASRFVFDIRLAFDEGRDPAVKHEGEVTLDNFRFLLELRDDDRAAILKDRRVNEKEFARWQRLFANDKPNRERRHPPRI